jgi:type II secretory ATPase GspE/PulE/Tfp pilus assembly ATPase PilB-like protein
MMKIQIGGSDVGSRPTMASSMLRRQSEKVRVVSLTACDACRQSGYKGRVGLFSLLEANDTVKKAVRGALGQAF